MSNIIAQAGPGRPACAGGAGCYTRAMTMRKSPQGDPARTGPSPAKASLFGGFLGGDRLRAEKARMEAFLAAVPGEYCGWSADGVLACSEGFCQLLGLARVGTLQDVQGALSPSDAMALEGLFTRLQTTGEAFCMQVRTIDRVRTLKLCASRGRDSENLVLFHIIWLEDISADAAVITRLSEQQNAATQEITRLQAALDTLPVPLWMRDARTALVWCNRAYARMLDSTPASVVAEQREFPITARPAASRGPRPPGPGLAQAARDNNTPESTQAHIVLGGARRLLLVNEYPLPNLGMTLGHALDITRQEELETEQRRNVAANKELLEHLGSAIAIFNAAQKIEFFNTAFAQLWQLEEQWLNTGPKLGDIMEKLRETRRLPEQADFRNFKQSWLNMFTGLITTHEDMLYLPDGRALRMLVIPHPLGGLMMTFEDVTSRLELESSYNTLIAVQRETIDNLDEGVAAFGGDGRLKLWNPSFARLWDLNPEDLSGEPHITRLVERMKGFFPPHTWDRQRDILVAFGIDRNARQERLMRTDQTLVDVATVPLPDGGVLVTQVDVTSTVRVQTALRERNAALETAERLKLDFLANVSYQLRTPLNAIMGFSEILDKQFFGTLNDKQREYTQGLQEAGGRLVSLIDDILDLSTIEAGYMELDRVPVAPGSLLRDMAELVRDWAGSRKITLGLDIDPDTPHILADERRVKQVIINLVRNAIAFTPEGGRITLSTSQEAGMAGFAVRDSGPGIAAEDQERIFQPFERLSGKADGPQDTRGAGLGLSLVKNIVVLHGGKITLDSAPGRGTTVRVVFPVTG